MKELWFQTLSLVIIHKRPFKNEEENLVYSTTCH